MTPTISLLVVVCNDEFRLPFCISSAADFVDEVVIVVQESTDSTLAIARDLAHKIVLHPCLGHCEASWPDGVAACSGDWVLYLDADEELTEYAQDRLRDWCQHPQSLVKLRRLTTVDNEIIEDQAHSRLFYRPHAHIPNKLHNVVTTSGKEISVEEEVCIFHHKTSTEQREDDERYRMIQ